MVFEFGTTVAFLIDMKIVSTILNSSKTAFSVCSLVIFAAAPVYAQTYESQRDKPASNGNPDNPKMNPSLFPDDPATMNKGRNPLIKRKKRGSTHITPKEEKNARPQGEN